ncbi:MAG: DUF3034 family protein [Xanthomonadales bacterium]|nr:DUF3034 family protein [Xanthomonadales bacterium]
MQTRTKPRVTLLGIATLTGCMLAATASANGHNNAEATGGKLLLTGGVTEIGGAAGGGLTPWAVIGGYGTQDQIGANAFVTHLNLPDYHFDAYGAMIGFYNRVELSVAKQRFDTEKIGGALGLGNGFSFEQTVIGVKVRLFGDLVLDQGSWMPQVAVGVQHKKNNQEAVVKLVGAKDAAGTDYYVSASKLLLGQSLLLNATVRFTKANQIGILGFVGDNIDTYDAELEGSLAYLLNQHWAIGAEYRQKPNNLGIAKENDWYDAFVAWAPNKHISLTLAYAELGNIVLKNHQHGVYLSMQIGF